MVDIRKNINRLAYTISNQNKPNQKDADALNEIQDWVDEKQKVIVNDYHLFSKLFINCLVNDTIKNNGEYSDAIGTLKMVIRIDLEEHYKNFEKHINHTNLEEQLKHTRNIDDINFKKWTYQQTEERLNNLLSNLIEDYS